jgi:glycosyltransferase involved in cell wall biosynthesis
MAPKASKAKKRTKALNIAQLHWGFPPHIGGVETHLTIMLPKMVKRGHTVSLLTGSIEGSRARYKYRGVDVYRTPLMDLNWLYKRGLAGLDEDIRKMLNHFLDKVKPDVIHTHNMHYFSKVHAKAVDDVAKKRGIPLFLTAHNVWDDTLFLDLLREVDWTHVIAVSHYIKKELIGAGYDDRKVTVIHHGVDIRYFRPGLNTADIVKKFPQLKNRKVIFHPARIGLAKGCDTSIKALNIVKKRFPDALLVLAGSKNIIDWGSTQQKDIAYLVSLIKYFKMEKNVLIDAFTLEEVAQIYGMSHVCLYPSTSGEPFGLTMLEALASAKPMIVTDSGGMPEIIRDGINGYVIPIKDFEVLASRIIQLLVDDQLRERLGYTGRQMVESYYTQREVTKHTLDVYRKFLKRKRKK